jgi:hypothetical protein
MDQSLPRRREFPARSEKFPCAYAERNLSSLPQVFGNTTSTHFAAPRNRTDFENSPCQIPCSREIENMADYAGRRRIRFSGCVCVP